MPSLPGNSSESSKHTYIPSPSSTPRQHHSSTALAASSSLSSPPHSVPDIHVERSRSRASGGVGGSMTGEDFREGRSGSGRVQQSSSGSYGGSYGNSRGFRSKKGGGGFLLGMGGGYGTSFPLKQVERDGVRSASDPIARRTTHNVYADHYSRTEAASSSSNSQRRSVDQDPSGRVDDDDTGLVGGENATVDSDTNHLDEIFSDGDDIAATIVKMAEGMSENRRTLFGGRVQVAKEGIDLATARSLSSGSRGGSSRPFSISTNPQGLSMDSRRRSRIPSAVLPPDHPRSQTSQSQPEAPHLYTIEAQYLEHQKRHHAQAPIPSPLRLPQPLSPAFAFQQQPRTLPFNQVQIPYLKLNPSASTLARAAKARQYLDLFIQYIDLLGSLPPATEVPNFPHSQQQQQSHYHHNTNQQVVPPQHPLRKYNPLQTIRNRRLRNRQGLGQLDLTPWEDAVVVDSWVDSSINTFTNASLQTPQGGHDHSTNQRLPHLPPPPLPPPLEKGKSKPKRSKLDWVVHPSEMFADFYWMNECGGKNIMEDRCGGRIFRMGSASTMSSNNSAPSSVGARGSMEKSRASGRGKNSQEEQHALGRWSLDYGERHPINAAGMSSSTKGDSQDDVNTSRRRDRSFSLTRDAQAMKAIQRGGSVEGLEDMSSHKHPEQTGDLSLPAGPGITIGIGGGYVSPDDSPYGEDSEGEAYNEKKGGRASMESRRYSSQIEDDVVPGEIPIRRTFFENSEKMGIEKTLTRKRHHHHRHHHSYRFGHHRRPAKEEEANESSASSSNSSASDSEARDARRRHRKWTPGRRGRSKAAGADDIAEVDASTEEDLTADGEDIEDLDQSRVPKSSLFAIRKLKQKTRKGKRPASKTRVIGDSDYDTNYESAAAVSRSPSPAVTPYKESTQHPSLDHSTRAVDFAHIPPLQSRTTLAPPSDKRPKNAEQSPGNLNSSPYLVTPSPGRTPGEERGRERKDSKDDGLGIFFKRAISPMKLARRSGEYACDEEMTSEKNFEARTSKESERDAIPSLEKEKDKEKKSRAKGTVKKAAEKVGNRVERIKNGVGGLVWGRDTPQSVPSSNYASSMGSAGGASDKEDSEEDIKEKPRKGRLSVDLDAIFRSQKKKSKPGHAKQLSAANLAHLELDSGTATPSDASVDGDGDELARRGSSNKNDELPKLEIPRLKIMGPSREHSPIIRRIGSGLTEAGSYEKMRPGGVRLKREKSRLGEEIKSDSPAIERLPYIAPLGRVALPPIATVRRRGPSPTKQRYMGRKDIARTRALMLSTGTLARGMASQTQTREHKNATTNYIGTLQLTTYHHTISAKHLSSQIHSSAQDLDSKILAFRTATLSHLRNQILGIQDEVSEKLTPLVQTTADEADVLSGELSTKYVLEVKRLNDEVSTLARKRRRTTLKWMRRGGYVLLEWVVLGVMWWVWLIVVMVRMVRVVVGGIGRGLKWIALWK